MRWVRRLILLAAMVLGSVFGLDQWRLHADTPSAPPSAASKPAKPREFAKIGGPFESPAACAQALRGRSQSLSKAASRAARRGPRLGTWNVRWFPMGTQNGKDPEQRTDVTWLACAIALLDVDVLAVQEFLDNPQARTAALDLTQRLDALTGGRYKLELDDCAGSGRQHVGLLWNERRVTLSNARSLPSLNPTGSACGGSLRPGFGAHARFQDGTDLHVVSVHLDSGEKARDFDHRGVSASALGALLPKLQDSDTDALVLGDYNAMGCDVCAPPVPASGELAALDAKLGPLGLTRLQHAAGNPCSHYYRGHAGLLDLAYASESLRSQIATTQVDGVCAALACGRAKRGESPLAWQTLSDHCPLVIQLKPRAAHANPAGDKEDRTGL